MTEPKTEIALWKVFRSLSIPATTWHDEKGWQLRADKFAAALKAQPASDAHPSGKAEEGALCKHEWRYVGVDYHGSHKDEDQYECTLCRKHVYEAEYEVLKCAALAAQPASVARPSGNDGLVRAVADVFTAYEEYDQRLCCDGRECGCQAATVHQEIQHYLVKHLTALRQPTADSGEPVAWLCERTLRADDNKPHNKRRWGPAVSLVKQNVTPWQRNVEPLFRATAQPVSRNDEGEPYGGGELCSQCGELYGHGATYFDDGRVVCEECEGAQAIRARDAGRVIGAKSYSPHTRAQT